MRLLYFSKDFLWATNRAKAFLLLGTFALMVFPLLLRPTVFSGDEPHYLLVLNSLIKDHDWELANNYSQTALRQGQAGKLVAGQGKLDHHTFLISTNHYYFWKDIFDQSGRVKNPDLATQVENYPERSIHPPLASLIYLGPSLLLSQLLTIEQSALVVTEGLASLTLLLVFWLTSEMSGQKSALLSVWALALSTPFWFYSQTVYPEVLVALLLLLGLAFQRRQMNVLAGLALGLLVGLRLNYAMVLLPFLIFPRGLRTQGYTLTGWLIGVALVLGINWWVYGHPLFFSALGFPWIRAGLLSFNITGNLLGLLFSANSGLLPFAPFLIFTSLGITSTLRPKDSWGLLIGNLVLLLIVSFSFWQAWDGGYSFANRFLVGLLPLAVILAGHWWRQSKNLFWLRVLFLVLLWFSFQNQVLTVYSQPWWVVKKEPLIWQIIRF